MSKKMTFSLDRNLLIVFGSFVLIFIGIDLVVNFFASSDLTIGYLVAAIMTIVAVVVLEILVFKHNLITAFQYLGFGPPDKKVLATTIIIGSATLLFFPVFSSITGATITMPEQWLWKLFGIVAIHGVAEEVLFRGFLFHHFRSTRTFHQAGLLSLVAFAIAHIYLFTYMPAPLALFATLLSLVSAFPFAYLFERGNNTIWAPAVLHTLIHAVSFFAISEAFVMASGIAWMSMWIVLLLVVYGIRKMVFESFDKR